MIVWYTALRFPPSHLMFITVVGHSNFHSMSLYNAFFELGHMIMQCKEVSVWLLNQTDFNNGMWFLIQTWNMHFTEPEVEFNACCIAAPESNRRIFVKDGGNWQVIIIIACIVHELSWKIAIFIWTIFHYLSISVKKRKFSWMFVKNCRNLYRKRSWMTNHCEIVWNVKFASHGILRSNLSILLFALFWPYFMTAITFRIVFLSMHKINLIIWWAENCNYYSKPDEWRNELKNQQGYSSWVQKGDAIVGSDFFKGSSIKTYGSFYLLLKQIRVGGLVCKKCTTQIENLKKYLHPVMLQGVHIFFSQFRK